MKISLSDYMNARFGPTDYCEALGDIVGLPSLAELADEILSVSADVERVERVEPPAITLVKSEWCIYALNAGTLYESADYGSALSAYLDADYGRADGYELRDSGGNVYGSRPADPESEFMDVRLQCHNGNWYFHTGSSDYDQDHRGLWGSASVDGSEDRDAAKSVARDLIQQVMEDFWTSPDVNAVPEPIIDAILAWERAQ